MDKNISVIFKYQDKAKKTCLEKYGEEYVTRTKDFQEKRNKTNLEKYRCISPLGNKEVIKKYRNKLKKFHQNSKYRVTGKLLIEYEMSVRLPEFYHLIWKIMK